MNKLEYLKDCARYIIDTEYDDFANHVALGEKPQNHIYYTAYRGLFSELTTNKMLSELRIEIAEQQNLYNERVNRGDL